VVGLKTLEPPIDGGAGDVQDPTDAQLIPSLIVELDDLETRLCPRGLVVIVAKREFALHGDGAVLPEPFDRLGVNAVLQLAQENPGQFTVPESVVEGFEACEFCHDGFWDLLTPARTEEFRVLGEKAEHPVLPKASRQIAHGFGVHLGFLGPLRGGAIAKEHQRTNHLIPPLDVIDKVQLELGAIWQGVHQ
jgi:hypothetical protein